MLQWEVVLQKGKLSEKPVHIYKKKDVEFLKYKFITMKA